MLFCSDYTSWKFSPVYSCGSLKWRYSMPWVDCNIFSYFLSMGTSFVPSTWLLHTGLQCASLYSCPSMQGLILMCQVSRDAHKVCTHLIFKRYCQVAVQKAVTLSVRLLQVSPCPHQRCIWFTSIFALHLATTLCGLTRKCVSIC